VQPLQENFYEGSACCYHNRIDVSIKNAEKKTFLNHGGGERRHGEGEEFIIARKLNLAKGRQLKQTANLNTGRSGGAASIRGESHSGETRGKDGGCSATKRQSLLLLPSPTMGAISGES